MESGSVKSKYAEIIEYNTNYFESILKSGYEFTVEQIKGLMYNGYKDPDCFYKKETEGIITEDIRFSGDGIFSMRRIMRHFEKPNEMVGFYRSFHQKYTEPLFCFPCERGGINSARRLAFNDRPDCTLFDLKNYLNGNPTCIKYNRRHHAHKWLEWLKETYGSEAFKALVDFLNVNKPFVNSNYEIFDIEKGERSILNSLPEKRTSEWSLKYFNNLRNLLGV